MSGILPVGSLPPPTRLVGREPELAGLISTVQSGFLCQPAVALVTGEPGVGKTRLLTELISTVASSHEVAILTGHAIEGGGMLAYFPVSRAISAAAARLTQSEPASHRPASVLALAGLVSADFEGYQAPAELQPEAARLRLFDAFAEICLLLAREHPVLLAFDDLHWADAGTWDIIAYLARAALGSPLCIVVACRDEIFASGGTGLAALEELNRQRLLSHFPLARLDAEAVRLLGEELLGGQLADELAATLVRRSEGNPFFAEEVLRGLQKLLHQDWSGAYYLPARERAAADSATPATLRLTIVHRLERLPAETQAALRAAAILGRSFPVRLLAQMLVRDVDSVERDLGPAVEASLVASSAGEYAFRHDVIRETAYELAAGERRRLHAAAARGLEGEGVQSFELLATLARHWREADMPLVAAKAATGAAQAATRAAAFNDAYAYASAACRLYEQALTDGASADDVLRARIACAEAALTCAEYAEAEAAFRLALHEAESRGDRRLQGRLLSRLGVLFRRRERPEDASACFREALVIFEDDGDCREDAAEVLVELAGLEGLTRARYREAMALGERALAAANDLQKPGLAASAALTMAGIRVRAVDPTEGRPFLHKVLDLAGTDVLLAAEACAQLTNSYYWSGELQRSLEFARRRLELAERAGDVFGMRHAHSWLANVLLTLGRWDEALALLDHCEPLLARLDSPEPIAFVRQMRAVIAYHRGAFDDAYVLGSEAIQLFERVDPGTVVWYRGVLILTCLALGRWDEAERHLRLQEARLEEMPESALPARSARTVLGLAYVALDDRQRAADCERALRPYVDDHHWWLARRTLASLAALRGATQLALAELELAEQQARTQQLLPDLALILLQRAELMGLDGAPGRAALEEAVQLLDKLGMHAAIARANALLVAAPPTSPAGLTRREVEVLRHLAQGKTNREIAAALVISEHTVVNHLSHIFGKIGVENRTGAVAFALRESIV